MGSGCRLWTRRSLDSAGSTAPEPRCCWLVIYDRPGSGCNYCSFLGNESLGMREYIGIGLISVAGLSEFLYPALRRLLRSARS